MAVDAELGIVGKVGAELQEERPEVLIDAVEIVVVDHRGGFHDPRIGSAGVPAAATLRAHDPRHICGRCGRPSSRTRVPPTDGSATYIGDAD
jgi:hypothetical protein